MMRSFRRRGGWRWMVLVAMILVGVAVMVRLVPGGGVDRRTFSRIRAGMPRSEVQTLLGSAPDNRARISGRISGLQAPGPEPLRWFTYESWDGPDLTIMIYSDEKTGEVVKRDAIERGSGFRVFWLSGRVLRQLGW